MAHVEQVEQATQAKPMDDLDFMNFISATSARGGTTINFKTSNVSKRAQALLATDYKPLAKQHLNANVIHAYYNNDTFKAKMDEVANSLGITIIA